jgi:hypothetical protein
MPLNQWHWVLSRCNHVVLSPLIWCQSGDVIKNNIAYPFDPFLLKYSWLLRTNALWYMRKNRCIMFLCFFLRELFLGWLADFIRQLLYVGWEVSKLRRRFGWATVWDGLAWREIFLCRVSKCRTGILGRMQRFLCRSVSGPVERGVARMLAEPAETELGWSGGVQNNYSAPRESNSATLYIYIYIYI